MSKCELCEREDVDTTVHHLLPKEMGGTFGPTAHLCIPCHKQIHALYTNEEIAARLTTIQDLKKDPQLSRFLKWILVTIFIDHDHNSTVKWMIILNIKYILNVITLKTMIYFT